MSYFIVYVVSLFAGLAMDAVWLTATNEKIYQPVMGPLMLAKFNVPPAAVFYLLYPIGLMIFVIVPAMKAHSFTSAIFYGALLGALVYMTYDLTNFATLRGWTLNLSLIDIAWGTFLSGATCGIAYLVAPLLGAKIG
jgi:uncharacterized membrane protein